MKKSAYVNAFIAVIFIYGYGLNVIDCRGDAAGIQPRQYSFEYRGISINYQDQGQGQPLILLHGYGASTYSWRYVSPYFSKSYRVITIDLKGFGLSDKPTDDDYSVSDQSKIIYEFIRLHHLENVVLVGHSLGGAVSLLTYCMQSDHGTHHISKLILIDTASYKQNLPDFISLLRVPIINELSLYLTTNNFKSRMILRKTFFDHSKITEEMVSSQRGRPFHRGNGLNLWCISLPSRSKSCTNQDSKRDAPR
jgi:pimeloyl-ACP methyl ester carboxylesterase